MTDKRCVIQFLKLPEPGNVKSRLVPALGEKAVLELYECMVRDTIDTLRQAGVPFRICFDPPEAGEQVARWLGQEYAYMPQHGRDLGERMACAFSDVFSEGVGQAVLIGSDIPGLSAGLINDAFQTLATDGAAIGPAKDGGYYLIGFRANAFTPEVFSGIAWSIDQVFRETIDRFGRASISVRRLPMLADFDREEDIEAFLSSEQARVGASRTRSFLESHRFRRLEEKR